MAERVTVSSYTKNLIKSAGYIGMDILGSYAPTITNLGRKTTETTKSIYESIKNFTAPDSSDINFKSITDKGKSFASNAWNNIVEDLKTGKIYNKERADKLDSELGSSLFGDFDFDLGFDDFEDWGDDDDGFSEQDFTKAQVAANVQSTKAILEAVNASGSGLSKTIIASDAASTDYIVSSSRENTQALYSLNKEGFSTMTKALMTINDTIVGFSKIGEPLTAHMQNSTNFFARTGESLKNIETTLKNIEKNTTPAPSANSRRGSFSKKNNLGSMLNDDGFDFGALVDYIKDEIKGLKDSTAFFTDMFKPVVQSGGKNVNFLGMGATSLLKMLIPRNLSNSIKGLDESVKYGLGAGIVKASKARTGIPAIDFILNQLLPEDSKKRTISTNRYEKGPVAWDGVARKALVDVIPTTLLQIYSVLSGTDPMRYDYDSGRFVKTSSIIGASREKKMRYVKEAGGEFYEDVERSIRNSSNNDKKKRKMLENMDKFFEYTFDNDGFDVYKRSASHYGIDEETFNLIKTILSSYDKSNKKGTRKNKWAYQTSKSNSDYTDALINEENSGFSLTTMLYSELGGKGKRNSFFGTDEYGHDAFFYMQGIWQSTQFLAQNMEFIGGGATSTTSAPDLKAKSLPKIPKARKPRQKLNDRDVSPLVSYRDDEEDKNKIFEQGKKDFEEWVNNTETQDKGFKGFIKKFIQRLKGSDSNSVGTLSAIKIIDSISSTINSMIFGTEENPERGLMGFMFDKAKELFKSAQNWFKSEILPSLKARFASLFGEDGRFEGFWNETKDNLRGVKNSIKGSVQKVVFGRKLAPVNNGNAAYGRKVTKSGIVNVSEGELIIPSEYNPFYHGATNKAAQRNREARNARKFYGSFADGGMVSGDGFIMGNSNDFTEENIEESTFNARHKFTYNSLLGLILRGATNAFSGLKAWINKETDEKKIEEGKKKLQSGISSMLDEMGAAKGRIGAGAILGAGSSILLGGIVGPIAGAALGAGIGFVSKSKAAQDFLFGKLEVDKDGNPIEGSRKHQKAFDFLTKNLPGMGKGAAIGGIGGLFMGSPVIGAVLGSAVGFAVESESFKDWLFGKKDKNGKRADNGAIPKEVQEKLKKTLPAIAAGGAAGLLIGPFGLVGNVLFGSALGFGATTTKFHDFMFGKEGDENSKKKSLTSVISEKIFGGIDNIFHNMSNRLKVWGANLGRSLNKAIFKLINRLQDDSKNGTGSFLSRALGLGLRAGGAVLGAPIRLAGAAINAVDQRIQSGNLYKGYSVYNRAEKRNYTASERISARENTKARGIVNKFKKSFLETKFDKFDDFLASIENYSELEYYKELINAIKVNPNNSPAFEEAANKLLNDSKFTKYMGSQGTIGLLKRNISKLSQLLNDEGSRSELSKEKSDEKRSIDLSNNVADIKTNLKDLLRIISENLAKGIYVTNTKPDSSNVESDEVVTYEPTLAGDPVKMIQNEQGEMVPDLKDKETVRARSKMNKFLNSVNQLPLIGGLLGRFFGKKKDDEEKEKKPSLLSKIFDWLKDKVSSAKEWLDGKLGLIGLGSGSGLGLGSILSGAGLAAAIANALWGDPNNPLNKFLNLMGEKFLGTGKDNGTIETSVTETSDGTNLHQGEDGQWYDDDGNLHDFDELVVRRSDTDSLTSRFKKTTVRQLLTGRPTLPGAMMRKTALGKKVLGTTAKSADDIIIGAYTIIDDGLKGFTKILGKLPYVGEKLTQLASNSKFLKELYEGLRTKLAKGAEKAATFMTKAVPIVREAFLISDFVTGWEDARTTLGIVDEPTMGQRCISGLLRVIKNLIPFIGPMIPDDFVVDIFCKYVAPIFGLNPDELMKQREEAKATVSAYNQEHGTDYDVSQYNKSVLKDYTFTERIGNSFRTTKEQAKAIGAKIKNQGIGAYFGDAGSAFGEAFHNESNVVSGLFSGIGAALRKLLPGIIGEIPQKWTEIFAKSFKGDLEGVWSTELEEFSGGQVNEDGIKTADVSVFSRIIGNIPLGIAKFAATPISIVTWAGKKVLDFITGIFKKVGKTLKPFAQGFSDGIKNRLHDEKFEDLDDVEDDDGNPLSGFQKGLMLTGRIVAAPIGFIMNAGQALGIFIKNIATKVKNSVKTFGTTSGQIITNAFTKSPVDMWKTDTAESDPDNPVGGFTHFMLGAEKVLLTIPSGIAWVGRKVGEFAKNHVVKPIKMGIGQLANITVDMGSLVLKGEPGELIKYSAPDDESNPFNGFNHIVSGAAKTLLLGPTLISWVGHKIANVVHDHVIEPIKMGVNQLGDIIVDETSFVLKGEPINLLTYKAPDDENNPFNGFNHIVAGISKGILVVPSAISWIGHKIWDGISGFIDGIKSDFDSFKKSAENVNSYGDQSDFGKIHSETFDSKNPISGGIFKFALGIVKFGAYIKATMFWLANKVKKFGDDVVEKTGIGGWVTDKMGLKDQDTLNKENAANDSASAAYAEFEARKTELKNNGGGLSDSYKSEGFPDHKFGGKIDNGSNVQKYSISYSKSKSGKISVDGVQDKASGKYIKATYEGNKAIIKNADGIVIAEFSDRYDGNTFVDLTGGYSGILSRANSRRRFGKATGIKISGAMTPNGVSSLIDRSGFVSQLNPEYSNMRVGNNTVADAGCAPAVASMAIKSIGGDLSMQNAVKLTKGYTASQGVSTEYFNDVFKASGVPSSQLNSISSIKSNLKQGNPVVLLGRDPRNTSKDKSPFGPNNHYVLATGMKGNKVLINDPEANGPRVYDSSIINNSNTGIVAGRKGKGSRGGFSDTNDAKQIYAYLTTKEGFSPAGAAGIMGCWQNESNLNPNTIEGYYLSGYPGDEAVRSTEGLDNFTTNVLFPAYAGRINIKKSAYLGTDGHYYPGFGLAQWTGPRGQRLHEYSNTSGSPWYSLDNQLKFFSNEINNGYSGVKSTLQTATDPNTAADYACRKFEGFNGAEGIRKRQVSATEIYNAYSGQSYSYSGDSSSSSSSSGSGGSSSSSDNGGSILDIISSIFSAIGNIFNLKGFSMNTSSGSSSGSSSSGLNGHASERQALLDAMQSVAGKSKYVQGGYEDPEKGNSSCAGTVAWAYRKALGVDGMSAQSQIQSEDNRFTTIWGGNDLNGGGWDDSNTASTLAPGDIIYYFTEYGASGRLNHTEMFAGKGDDGKYKVWNQGGNPKYGPTLQDWNQWRWQRARKINRYTPFMSDDGSSTNTYISSSGSSYYDSGSYYSGSSASSSSSSSSNNAPVKSGVTVNSASDGARLSKYYDMWSKYGNDINSAGYYKDDYISLLRSYNPDYIEYEKLNKTWGKNNNGSGINSAADGASYSRYNTLKKQFGLGSGLIKRVNNVSKTARALLKSAPSQYVYGSKKGQRFNYGGSSGIKSNSNRFSGKGTSITDIKAQTTNILNSVRRQMTGSSVTPGGVNNTSVNYNTSGVDPALVNKLLDSIAVLLESISNNTAPINKIYEVLTTYLSGKGNNITSNKTSSIDTQTNTSDEIDSNVVNLVNTLAAIARG